MARQFWQHTPVYGHGAISFFKVWDGVREDYRFFAPDTQTAYRWTQNQFCTIDIEIYNQCKFRWEKYNA